MESCDPGDDVTRREIVRKALKTQRRDMCAVRFFDSLVNDGENGVAGEMKRVTL